MGLPSRIVGRQLMVNGAPFHMKGVCWNPVRKGQKQPVGLDFRGFVMSDAELMSKAGINVVRTYEAITDREVLDALWKKGISVLNTVYINAKDPVESIREKVLSVKDHPAILMWVVGNEWNYNGLYAGLPYEDAEKTVRRAIDIIKECDLEHPAATVIGEIPTPELIAALPRVDAWGINRYSGIDFGELFKQWGERSSAPMFLGEYGADAFDSSHASIDEVDQAKAIAQLTNQIVQASSVTNPAGGVAIGGFVFEFADEWWKDTSGSPLEQDIGGVSPGSGPFPDFVFNEEWWGLVQYDGTPRKAFWTYADIVVPGQQNSALRGGTPAVAAAQAGADGHSQVGDKLRIKACGGNWGCRGKIGYCCPNDGGATDSCCSQTTPAPPTPAPAPTTTWIPPAFAESDDGGAAASASDARPSGCEPDVYEEEKGAFVNGHFQVGTLGCKGVGECQFRDRIGAQDFCNRQPRCQGVLLHPFESDCAGGYGCYTPRFGKKTHNSLWERSGGRAWLRSKGSCAGAAKDAAGGGAKASVATGKSRFVLVGWMSAIQAQTACKGIGRLAMPKTEEDRREIMAIFDAAEAQDKMSWNWPKNTIWLGGQYNPSQKKWMWNDGEDIGKLGWGPGQPSATANQMSEQWLCMILNGDMHDAAPMYDFGVFCELDEPVDAPAALPMPKKEPVGTLHHFGDFAFAGMTTPKEARKACGDNMRLAMPKNKDQWAQLLEAVNKAIDKGLMSKEWPKTTLWLGSHWDSSSEAWIWDDGSSVGKLPWEPGQPSAAKTGQDAEPWACTVWESGKLRVHDCPEPFSFGVMCEKGERPEEAKAIFA